MGGEVSLTHGTKAEGEDEGKIAVVSVANTSTLYS
jgi:hypothetical protein